MRKNILLNGEEILKLLLHGLRKIIIIISLRIPVVDFVYDLNVPVFQNG